MDLIEMNIWEFMELLLKIGCIWLLITLLVNILIQSIGSTVLVLNEKIRKQRK